MAFVNGLDEMTHGAMSLGVVQEAEVRLKLLEGAWAGRLSASYRQVKTCIRGRRKLVGDYWSASEPRRFFFAWESLCH